MKTSSIPNDPVSNLIFWSWMFWHNRSSSAERLQLERQPSQWPSSVVKLLREVWEIWTSVQSAKFLEVYKLPKIREVYKIYKFSARLLEVNLKNFGRNSVQNFALLRSFSATLASCNSRYAFGNAPQVTGPTDPTTALDTPFHSRDLGT